MRINTPTVKTFTDIKTSGLTRYFNEKYECARNVRLWQRREQ